MVAHFVGLCALIFGEHIGDSPVPALSYALHIKRVRVIVRCPAGRGNVRPMVWIRSLTRLSEYLPAEVWAGDCLLPDGGWLLRWDIGRIDSLQRSDLGLSTPSGSERTPPRMPYYSAATTSFQCFSRIPTFTAVQAKDHSARTESSPRRRKRRTPRTCLI